MLAVIESVVIDRPPGAVFAFLADLENSPRWRTDVIAIERANEAPGHVGDRYREHLRPLLRRRAGELEVTGYRPARWLSFRDSTRPTEVRALYTLAEHGGGTRVTLTALLEPHGLAARMLGERFATIARGRMAFDLHRLKGVLEGSGAVPAAA